MIEGPTWSIFPAERLGTHGGSLSYFSTLRLHIGIELLGLAFEPGSVRGFSPIDEAAISALPRPEHHRLIAAGGGYNDRRLQTFARPAIRGATATRAVRREVPACKQYPRN
jgi:hypothetical protein